MKVCPDCQSRFTGGETFCPNDGTQLVDARELSPGRLTGLSLDDIVELEELETSDGLGERYRGKLDESGEQVRVTAFNQAFEPEPGRDGTLREALEAHPEPLPEDFLALHSYRLEGDPPFIVEEYPRGPSLRSLLNERKSLDWKTSVRIAANIARAGGYLVEHGILHSCIHPGSIFVTDVEEGRIQLGEWTHGVLSHRESPLEYADQHPDGFFGYAGYMAPETIRDGKDIDQRSVVYVAGMLLYEMIVGKAPFTSKKSEDTLKRHLHEKPLKLAIAKSGADLHPELDDVLDMMWIKAPERRFQNQTAAIGALASLLDTSPDVLAPELTPREEPVFDGPPTDEKSEESEESAQNEEEDASDSKKTMMGLPSVATKEDEEGETKSQEVEEQPESAGSDEEDREDDASAPESEEDEQKIEVAHQPPPESGPSPSIIIEDPELRSAMNADKEGAADEGESDDAAEGEVEADEDEEVDEPERQTMLMGGQVSDVEDEDADEDGGEADEEATEDESEEDEDVDEPQKETLLMGGDAGWDSLDEEFDSEPSEETEQSGEEEEPPEADEAEEAEEEGAEEEEQTDEAEEAEEEEQTDEAEEAEEEEQTDEAGGTMGQMAAADIGAVEVDDDGEDMSDDWFGKSTEETWETQQVEAVQAKSENLMRYATIGVLGALVLGVVAFFIFVETGSGPAEESADAGEATAAVEESTESDAEEVDLDRLRDNFEAAISGGRILSPRDNSAIKYLEELKRHGEDSEQYSGARETFVQEARTRAEKVEGEQVYLARNLAGAAAQFSEDEEIQTFADELDSRWRESKGDAADAGAEVGVSDRAAGAEPAESEQERVARTDRAGEPPRPERDAPARKPPKSASGSDKPAPSSGESVSSLLSKAKSAQSGGDSAEAKRLYRKVLDVSSSNSRALSSLGQLHFDDAAYSQAAKYYERAVRSSGGNMGYRLKLGMTYYKLGQFRRARDAWQAVLDRDPSNSRAQQYIKLVESKIN